MTADLIHIIPLDDRLLFAELEGLARHNGLHEFGNDFVPPKYTNPNYIAPHSGQTLLVTNAVLLFVACFIMAGRIYTKLAVTGGIGGDDIEIAVVI